MSQVQALADSAAVSEATSPEDAGDLIIFPHDSIKLEPQPVAKGGNGAVYRGRIVDTGLDVVVKVPRRQDAAALQDLREEGLMMRAAAHEYVVKCYGLLGSADPEQPFRGLVLQAGMGDFHTLIRCMHACGQPPTIPELARDVLGAARAGEQIHARGLVHGDMKPANFIVSPDDKVLVSDFGSAQRVGPDAQAGLVTLLYGSPQACRGEAPTRADDVFAFAMTLCEAASGEYPYPVSYWAHGEARLKEAICGGERPPLPESWDPLFRSMLAACWQEELADRPDFTGIAECLEILARLP